MVSGKQEGGLFTNKVSIWLVEVVHVVDNDSYENKLSGKLYLQSNFNARSIICALKYAF